MMTDDGYIRAKKSNKLKTKAAMYMMVSLSNYTTTYNLGQP
jgi:hypothetical protein